MCKEEEIYSGSHHQVKANQGVTFQYSQLNYNKKENKS